MTRSGTMCMIGFDTGSEYEMALVTFPDSGDAGLNSYVEQAIPWVLRHLRLHSEDARDVAQAIRLHFLERRATMLSRHRGESRLETFVCSAARRVAIDWLRRRDGRWRPSADARRSGQMAVQLQWLVERDGLTALQAAEAVSHSSNPPNSLINLARALTARRAGARAGLAAPAAKNGRSTIGDPVELHEVQAAEQRIRDAFRSVFAELSDADRHLLSLRFAEERTYAEIASILGVTAKAAEHRVARLLQKLRQRLMAGGVAAQDVAQVIDGVGLDVDLFNQASVARGLAEPTPGWHLK